MSSPSNPPLQAVVVGLAHLHPRSYMAHLKQIEGLEVGAVAEADPDLRSAFCNEFGTRGYASLDDLLATEHPDLALLFLPHAHCPEAAEKCAAKGIHLLVEKPMAASASAAQRMVDAARAGGVLLSTAYVWRHHPVAARMRELIRDGSLGRVVGCEGRCAAGRLSRYIEGHAPWMLERALSGGGPMYNLGVHWIDLFRWLLSEEVVEVSGRNVRVNTAYDIEDNSFAHLRFAGGAVAALDISYTVPDAFPYGRDLYLSVRGTQGVVSWAPAYEGERDSLVICSDHPRFRGSPNIRQEFQLDPTPGYAGFMGRDYLEAFLASIRGGAEPLESGEDGVAALKVVEAVYRSDAERCWVPV